MKQDPQNLKETLKSPSRRAIFQQERAITLVGFDSQLIRKINKIR